MRVFRDIVTEELVFSFSLEHREMAKLIFQDAIIRYKNAGFDVSRLVELLLSLEHNDVSIH